VAFCDVRLVLIFDVVRLSAPVPWLSGRASASHAEGRWFDPSRDHRSDYRGQRVENAFRRPADPPWQSAIWGQNGAKLASAPTVVNVVERVERCRDVVKFVVK
jgi:hypothetical protein